MSLSQQRRRRLLSDDAAADGTVRTTAPSSKRSTGPTETYTSQARRDQQPRLTDLVPTRFRTLLLVYLLGLLVVGAVELLYFHLDALAVHVVRQSLGVFDLASRGSFAAWYSSLLLSITAALAALIYTLRRHRIDDYRGRYRIWIWATLGFLLLAVNQTADVDDLLGEVVDLAARRAGISSPWIWPGLCATVWLACVARLSFELYRSRSGLLIGWLGAMAWLASTNAFGLLDLESPTLTIMLAVGLKLLGQLTILAAHTAYARYVLLDAHGLLPARGAAEPSGTRRRREARRGCGRRGRGKRRNNQIHRTGAHRSGSAVNRRAQSATTALARSEAERPTTASFARPAATAASTSSQSSDSDDDEDDDDAAANRGLTRAERKRLRRERKLDQRRTAA